MDILNLISNTPLIQSKTNKNIFFKCEFMNLTGSVKDRASLFMIKDLLNRYNKNINIIEATSGNTGISLSLIAKYYGLRLSIVMPESMSIERRNFIKVYGAKLILTPANEGMKGSIKKANEIIDNKNTILLNQFSNSANPQAHYETTGVEIYKQLGDIDIFVCGVGTGGTISGVGRYLKERNKNIKIVALEPKNSAVISKKTPGIHKIQGIGAGFIPKNLDLNIIDDIITIDDDEALGKMRYLSLNEGLFVGISSGANFVGAEKLSKKYPNKKIVTILADRGERYFSVLT